MKKYLIYLLIGAFASSMVFMGIGCKEAVTEPVEEVVEEVEEAVEEVEEEVEEEVAPSVFTSEEEWLASLEGKWEGEEITFVCTAFLAADDIDEAFFELTGCKVNAATSGWDEFVQKSRTLLATQAAEGMDVIMLDNKFVGEFGDNGWYVPMQDMIFEGDKDDIIQSYLDSFTYAKNGDLIGIPNLSMTYLLFYNPELLSEGGYDAPPKTMDELKSMSVDLISQGIVEYGTTFEFATGEMAYEDWAIILTSMGGKLWNDDFTALAYNEGGFGLKALNYLIDGIYTDKWINPNSVNYYREDAIQPFLRGEEPFKLVWQFMWPLAVDPEQSAVADVAKFTLIPYDEGATYNTWASSGSLGPSPFSQKIDIAKDYCRFYGAKANAMQHFEKRGFLPMWESLYSDPKALEIEPNLPILLEASKMAGPVVSVEAWYAEAAEILYTEISNAYVQGVTPEEALANVEAKINQRFAENWE